MTRHRKDPSSPNDSGDMGAIREGDARSHCNDCNEVARLGRVARNALMNGDFPRVIAVLDVLASLAGASGPLTFAQEGEGDATLADRAN